ncbi:hypothetical protein GCM10010193_69440 [Kitasatospora atroaurantiaca]|uniref:Uncharacterized protein n=1 Tax=Kitasatospora atroaurantiaca TaxID=285545 RepID=A0A561EN33_9ACTN|nr:hypothetical protein [Kitasatospora atroaurantiaca]TWE17031.1 hypothetical protein FB465_2035 [Kitasatospora atroaurantiaca]
MNLNIFLRGRGRRRAADRIPALTVERDAARQACAVLRIRLAAADDLITDQYRNLMDVRLDNAQLRVERRRLADEVAELQGRLDAALADTIEIPFIKVIHVPAESHPGGWGAADAPQLALAGGAR